MATKLDTVFYELEVRDKAFADGVDRAKSKIKAITDKTATVKVNADTKHAETGFKALGEKILGAHDQVEQVDLSIKGMAERAVKSLAGPTVAAGLMAAAVAAIALKAVESAEAFEQAFLPLQSTLTLPAEQLETLKQSVIDLTLETPRSAESLALLGGELAKMGEHDPAQIAADLRVLALAGDALGQTDLKPFAETLDLIGDAFRLTAEQARQAFVQITAMSKGRIDMADFNSVLEKSATRMNALGISAVDTAAAIVELVDKGVTQKQATTSLIDLLDKASRAERDALDAVEQHKEGDAQALRLFGGTVSQANIQSLGLVGTLGKLYDALGGDQLRFLQAGLSLADYTTAQIAANATAVDGKTKVLSYQEALDSLGESAAVNRESASALVGILKNELSAVLVDLGTKFLPPVITALTALSNLFNTTKRAASDASKDLRAGLSDLTNAATDRAAGQIGDASSRERSALVNAGGLARQILSHPVIIQSDGFELGQAKVLLEQAKKLGDQLSATGEAADKNLAPALAAVNAQLNSVGTAAEANAPKLTKTAGALDNTGAKAAAAIDKFKELTRSAGEFTSSLSANNDPLAQQVAKIALLREQITELIPELPKAKQAAARLAAGTIFDQMDEGLAQLRSQKISDLTDQFDALALSIGGNAVDAIEAETQKVVKNLKSIAEQAANMNDAGLAADVNALADKYRTEGDALEVLAKQQDTLSKAIDTQNGFLQQGDASYHGRAVSAQQYRDALVQVQAAEDAAYATLNSTTATAKQRAAAEKLLADAIAARKRAEGEISAPLDKSGESAIKLGNGLQTAAQGALALVQALGQSDSKLARLAAAGVSLGGGLKGLGEARSAAAKAAAGGDPQSNLTQLLAFAPAAGQIIGGVVAVAGALDLFGTKAKEHARQMRKAAVEFNRALEDFAVTERSSLDQALRDNITKARDLSKQAITSAGFSGGADVNSAADLKKNLDALRAIASAGIPHMSAAAAGLADQMQKLYDTTVANEAALRKLNDARLADATDDLRVRELIAQGHDAEATALRNELQRQRELKAAQQDTSDAGIAYAAALAKIQDEERAAEASVKRDPLKEFANKAKLFAITGEQYLNGLVDAYGAKFAELHGLLDGIDASTQSGLDALRKRAQDIAATLGEGGITDAEQAVIDGLFEILNTATDVFDSLDKRVSRAFAKLNNDNDVLGGDAATKLARVASASKGFNHALDDILSTMDTSTQAGADDTVRRLRELYATLGDADGPIVDIIKSLITGIGDVTNAATDATNKATADAEATRTKAATARASLASRNSAINDETGVAAFATFLTGLEPALAGLFSTFDVSSLSGIDAAKNKLRDIAKQLDGMTDDQIVAQFHATRDELTNSILALDSSLDQLKSTAQDSATAIAAAAAAQQDFTDAVSNDLLRARGNDRQADINASIAKTAARLDSGKALGVSQSVLDSIKEIGAADIAAINQKYDEAQAAAAARTASAGVSGSDSASGSTDARTAFVASAVTAITTTQALTITDVLSSALIEQRETKTGVLRLVDIMASLVGGALPALRVPVVPDGAGTGGVTNNFNFYGDISGPTPQNIAQQLVQQITPMISATLARGAGLRAKLAGGAL